MEEPLHDRRKRPRSQPQQQPQQSVLDPRSSGLEDARASHDSPRKTLQRMANIQAKKQSGKL